MCSSGQQSAGCCAGRQRLGSGRATWPAVLQQGSRANKLCSCASNWSSWSWSSWGLAGCPKTAAHQPLVPSLPLTLPQAAALAALIAGETTTAAGGAGHPPGADLTTIATTTGGCRRPGTLCCCCQPALLPAGGGPAACLACLLQSWSWRLEQRGFWECCGTASFAVGRVYSSALQTAPSLTCCVCCHSLPAGAR